MKNSHKLLAIAFALMLPTAAGYVIALTTSADAVAQNLTGTGGQTNAGQIVQYQVMFNDTSYPNTPNGQMGAAAAAQTIAEQDNPGYTAVGVSKFYYDQSGTKIIGAIVELESSSGTTTGASSAGPISN